MIKLSLATKDLLNHLESMEWLANVGKAIPNKDVPRVSSWKEAMASSTSKRESHVVHEMVNVLREKLCFDYPQRYHGKWNNIVMAIRKIWDPISVQRIEKIRKENKLSKAFVGAVNWDIVSACMELEYADLIPPRFFKDRLDWYLAGHFPCGWEGDFPEGRLIVF